jgi:hypothetical protein
VPSISTVSNGHWSFGIGVMATPIVHRGVGAFEKLNGYSWSPVFPEAPGEAGLF